MKKLLLLLLLIPTLCWAGQVGVININTDCNQAKYYVDGMICQDSDDKKVYKGTGAAVEEIGTGGLANIVEDTTPQLGGNLDGQAYSMDTTGLLSGGIATNTKSSAYTVGADNAREKYRGVIYVSGVTTITLPAIGAGMGVCIYSTDANIKSISPNASDRIVLDGTALADNTDIDSSGVAGEFACVLYDSASGWTVWGKGGTWASE